jgi:hypothetical protein
MKSTSFKNTLCFLFLILSANNFGQQIVLSKKARASIITCDTGNQPYSLFGHTAIRISDIGNNLDIVYNYGAFDFNTSNFVVKFAKGDLQYFAVATDFPDFMYQYGSDRRTVFEQELEIPIVYKQKLFDALSSVVISDKNQYTYKFIDRNCTTMVVDILNKTLGSTVIQNKPDNYKTYRTILFPYFNNFFFEKLGTSIIFGTKVDQATNHVFLPLELRNTLQYTKFENQLLCKQSLTLLEFEKQKPNSKWNNIYSYIGLLMLIVIINSKKIDILYIIALGIVGTFFTAAGFLSLHQELANNYNVLLINPTLLILAYFILVNNRKWIVKFSDLNTLFLSIYVVVLLNKIHFWIVLPLIVTTYIILQRFNKKAKKN